MNTLAVAFSKEAQSDSFKATLYTLERDSKAIHKVAMTYQNATTEEQAKMAKHCLHTLVKPKIEKTAQPHAMQESKTAHTCSPMCGAHARQTGRPCSQP